jgi:hypothetical protein
MIRLLPFSLTLKNQSKMKKIFLITLAILLAVGVYAQRTTYHEATIKNLKVGKLMLPDPVRSADQYWYASYIDATNGTAFTDLTPAKTYFYYVAATRDDVDTMAGDSRDVLFKGTYSNYAPNDASSQFQGIGVSGRNRSGGTFATMNAGEFGINNSSGATLTNAYGGTFTVENYGTLSTNLMGLKIDLRNEGAVATNEYGLYITNTNNSLGTAVDAAIKVADAGANIGWTAGIDMSGATVSRAIVFPTGAAADTTVKTAGAMIYLANYFWGCSGTFWYRLDPLHN